MKFSVERDVLADAVAWVSRAVPARPPVPVLAGVRIVVDDGGTVTLSSFDYEVAARSEFAADVESPGEALVSGRLLREIANALPHKPVQFVLDGTKFDSSVDRGQPATFPLSGVIKGWTEGLQLMPVGSKFKFFIPPALAYGASAPATIGPNQVLIFDVELINIDAPKPAAPAQPVTSDIIKVPSAEELAKGAKIEVIKPQDVERIIAEEKAKQEAASQAVLAASQPIVIVNNDPPRKKGLLIGGVAGGIVLGGSALTLFLLTRGDDLPPPIPIPNSELGTFDSF